MKLQVFDIQNSTLGGSWVSLQELAYGCGDPHRNRGHGMKGAELPPDNEWEEKARRTNSSPFHPDFLTEHQGATKIINPLHEKQT